MEQNYKFLFIYLLPALLISLPHIPFTTEEITGCTIEVAQGTNKEWRNLSSYCCCFFFFSCFTVLVTPSINTSESPDFMILIISFISSFKINKVNPFPALTVHFPLIFLPNLFIAFEVKLFPNSGKLSLAKRIATFISVILP